MNIDAEYINDIINLLMSGLNIDKTQNQNKWCTNNFLLWQGNDDTDY